MIVRVAARGDGVTADGRHAALAAPGDTLTADGALIPGPHHQMPPCRHFPDCGGCQLQHLDDAAYAGFIADRIAGALAAQGLDTRRSARRSLSPPAHPPPRDAPRRAARAAGRARLHRGGEPRDRRHRTNAMSSRPSCSRWSRRCAACSRRCCRQAPRRRPPDADRPGRRRADRRARRRGPRRGRGADRASRSATSSRASRSTTAWARDRAGSPKPVTDHARRRAGAVPAGRLPPGDAGGRGGAGRGGARGDRPARRPSPTCSPGSAPSRSRFPAQGLRRRGRARRRSWRSRRPRTAAAAPVFADHRDLFRRPLTTAELDRFDAVVLDPPRAGRARAGRRSWRRRSAPRHRLCFVQSQHASRAMRRRCAKAATGSTGSSRSASSAGRRMSSWRRSF